jgi:KaiC/GvpD/RAD55 family RecA-like ATPase/DNA-binding response OmpR family regulator
LYGPNGSGKTTFSLAFVLNGLIKGERCIYVTSRPAESVIRHANSLGSELESFLRSQQLILFESPASGTEAMSRVLDDSVIFQEFKALVGNDGFDRLVVDPVSPLVTGLSEPQCARRLRSLARMFSGGGATCLYLLPSADPESRLVACKDAVDGVLRIDGAEGSGRPHALVLERFPELRGNRKVFYFEITPGIGMREVERTEGLPALAPTNGGGHRSADLQAWSPRTSQNGFVSKRLAGIENGTQAKSILLIHPDVAERSKLRSLLQRNWPVHEASGAADGLSLIATEAPYLVIAALNSRGANGIEIARKARQNGRNMPIILLGREVKRKADRIAILEAGIDVCLDEPIDGRVLTLHVANLLSRSSGADRLLPEALPQLGITPPHREPVGCTSNFDYFLDRIRAEARFAQQYGLPVVLLAFRQPLRSHFVDQLADMASLVGRTTDIVLVGERGVAVLLIEADTSAPFLQHFRQRWTEVLPEIEHFQVGEGEDFVDSAAKFIVRVTGNNSLTAPVEDAQMLPSIGTLSRAAYFTADGSSRE